MSSYENILFEKKNPLAYVTINRPAKLNALNRAVMRELDEVFTEISEDDSIRAVILTGAGEKAFVAGADINELATQSPIEGKEFSLWGQKVLKRIENLGKPVIAAINGYALGGGCELALACTLRIASENARMGQPEVRLGIMAGYGGTQRLPRLVGKGMAMQLLLTGEQISGTEAFLVGLVNKVVPFAELIPTAEKMAQAMVANAPLAVKYSMEAVNRGLEVTQDEGLFIEAALFGLCCSTEDMKEGTKAFLEKRPAQFRGK
ncbi:MAG: enoyl-CoA hydratase-related protein [Terriglobia bacterium]